MFLHDIINEKMQSLNPSELAALLIIIDEYLKAKEKHPRWPLDVLHASSIVAEESGELVRAALQFTYEGGSELECNKEAGHTGATCLRFLANKPYTLYPNLKP